MLPAPTLTESDIDVRRVDSIMAASAVAPLGNLTGTSGSRETRRTMENDQTGK